MSFVHPGFLWFLSLLAIPILIHLFHFRRFKRFYFPSLKYLKEQEQEKKSVKKLRRLLILLTRLLALASLIFAFAQPFLESDKQVTGGIPVVSIYIDNSMSMGAKGTEGELLSEAKEASKKIIQNSSGNVRFFITTNSFSAIERKLHAKSTALQYIDQINFCKTPRPLNQVLSWQDEFLMRYHREEVNIANLDRIVFSDFQKSTATMGNYKSEKAPFTQRVHLIPCLPQSNENLSIDSVWQESPVHRSGQQLKLCFSVRNYGDEDINEAPITIVFDGKTRMTNVTVKAKSSAESYVYFTPNRNGYLKGKVSVSDRFITFDDDFYFVNKISKQGSILVIEGEDGVSNTAKVFQTEPFYSVQTCSEFSFSKRLLKQVDLVVLNGLNQIPSGLGNDLAAFSYQGGSVLCIPGKNINQPDYRSFLSNYGLNEFSGSVNSGNQLSEISYASRFFKGVFEKQQKSLNIPLFKKVYALKNYKQANAEVLMQFRNQLPFFLSVKQQQGTLYLLTADVSEQNGSFTSNALFPSLILRSAELSLRALPPYAMIGAPSLLEIETNSNEEKPLSISTNKQTYIPKQIYEDGLVRIQLNQPELTDRLIEGWYTIQDDAVLAETALNLNRSESETALISEEDIKIYFENVGFEKVQIKALTNGHSSFNLELDKPASFWRIFVWLTFLFLIAEMAIIKFWKQ